MEDPQRTLGGDSMQVGDLRVFKSHVRFGYANRLYVVTRINDDQCYVEIKIIDNGMIDHWDRIALLHDSKSVSDKKCP